MFWRGMRNLLEADPVPGESGRQVMAVGHATASACRGAGPGCSTPCPGPGFFWYSMHVIVTVICMQVFRYSSGTR